MFTQDIGSKEDMELNGRPLTLSWRELSVELPDTVSLMEIGGFFRSGALGTQRMRRGYLFGGFGASTDTIGDYNGAPGIGPGEPFNMQLALKPIF